MNMLNGTVAVHGSEVILLFTYETRKRLVGLMQRAKKTHSIMSSCHFSYVIKKSK